MKKLLLILLLTLLVFTSCSTTKKVRVQSYQHFIVDTVYSDSSFSILLKDNDPCTVNHMMFPTGVTMMEEINTYDNYVRIYIKQLGLVVSKNDTLKLKIE